MKPHSLFRTVFILITCYAINQSYGQEGTNKTSTGVDVVVLADGNIFQEKSKASSLNSKKEYAYHYRFNRFLKDTKIPLPTQLNKDDILKFIIEVNNDLPYFDKVANPTNISTNDGMAFFLETLLAVSAKSNMSETDLVSNISTLLLDITNDNEEEKYRILSFLSSRLDINYQDARNPGSNNSKNNPKGIALPESEIAFRDLLKGVYEGDRSLGGVCNDYSQVIGMIAEDLFPEKDVLVISGGTHMGTLITDGITSRIIDAGDQRLIENNLSLFEKSNVTNIRLSKVVDGKLKEIAVMDTEQGQLVNDTLDVDRPVLRTNYPLEKIVVHVNKWVQENNRKKTYSASLGSALLNGSHMIVIGMKGKVEGERYDKYAGLAYGYQNAKGFYRTPHTFHLRLGIDRKFELVDDPRLSVNLKTGVAVEGSFGSTLSRFDTAGNILLNNKLQISNDHTFNNDEISHPNIKFNTIIFLSHALGSKNYGQSTGVLSTVELSDITEIMKSLSFHLNQVVVNTSLTKELSPRLLTMANMHYQGSHVGQNVETSLGVSFLSRDKKREYTLLFGYDNSEIKGYSTKNNLIDGFNGASLGFAFENEKGTHLSVSLKELSLKSSPYFQSSLKIPLNVKNKKSSSR